MAKPTKEERAARKASRKASPKEVVPRKRLVYLRTRTTELKTELSKVNEERKSLQALVKSEKAAKAKSEGEA
jgi:predicted component of type VI protein secretion system